MISFIRFISSSFSIGLRIKQFPETEGNISEYGPEYISPAVRKQTLIFLSNLLISRYKAKPFRSGILISRIAKSYEYALNFSNANVGYSYESTTNPFSPKTFSSTRQTSDSSSTSKILFIFVSVTPGNTGYHILILCYAVLRCLTDHKTLQPESKVNIM